MIFDFLVLFSLLFLCNSNSNCSNNLFCALGDNVGCFPYQKFVASLSSESAIKVINSDIYKELLYHRDEEDKLSKRVLFVSYIDDNSFSSPLHYSRYSFTFNKAFCRLYGFDYLVLTNMSTTSESDPRWEKVNIVYFLLRKSLFSSGYNLDYDYFVWFDADLLFFPSLSSFPLANQEDIVHRLISSHPNSSILISSEYHAETGVANTGCFIVKNTVFSLLFFRTWLNDMDHSEGHDQILFDKLYKILLRNPSQSTVNVHLSSTLLKCFQSLTYSASSSSYISFTPFLSFPITSFSTKEVHYLLRETIRIGQNKLVTDDDSDNCSVSHIVILPANYLNSFPPVYYTFNENSSNSYVLHLMGESNDYRYKVFEGIYSRVCFDYLEQLDNSSSTIIPKYLGVTRLYLQSVFYEISMEALLLNWQKLLDVYHKLNNIVDEETCGLEKEYKTVINSLISVYLSSISEIRQMLVLLKKFPSSELGQILENKFSSMPQPKLNYYHSWNEFRLFVYYSLFHSLVDFTTSFQRNCSTQNINLLLELVNIRTLIGNDLLTEFHGNEGYRIGNEHDNLFINYYLLSSSSHDAQCDDIASPITSPEFAKLVGVSSWIPLSFSYDAKKQLISEVELLFSLLLGMVHSSDYLVVLAMKSVFLQNKSQFYFLLASSVSSDYCLHGFDSIKESLSIYEKYFFVELYSFSSHNNPSMFGNVVLSNSQKFPGQIYEMINSYSTLASLLCYCGDFSQTLNNTYPAVWYYDYAISLLETLLAVRRHGEDSNDTSLSPFMIQEHHFSLIRLYYQRILCSQQGQQTEIDIRDNSYYQYLLILMKEIQQKSSTTSNQLSDIEIAFGNELESLTHRLFLAVKTVLQSKAKRFRRKNRKL
jgi:hypothetical protein